MQPEIEKYKNLKICVAVSGGKDSMALLHYFNAQAKEFNITLSALNCDHKIRGEQSAKDSAFVREYCQTNGIPLLFFEYGGDQKLTEESARIWRRGCYEKAAKYFKADAIATAHHLNDNAETVLFNLARGSGFSGASGIKSVNICKNFTIIHPLISVTRAEIDEYVEKNAIPYVTDDSNFTNDYTRNKIRHIILPELEKAVPNAAKAIYRFSLICEETENYFNDLIEKNGVVYGIYGGVAIKNTPEKAVFERAALKVFYQYNLKDYTKEHIETLYLLQSASNGKKFEFLGLTAYKEQGRVAICKNLHSLCKAEPFTDIYNGNVTEYCGERLFWGSECKTYQTGCKVLKFDRDKIPNGAVIRFFERGDRFTKFGGGTKNLGDYFTDIKLPQRLRGRVPLVCDGSNVLIVCGVEISDAVKITDKTTQTGYVLCTDYRNA